MQKVEVTWFKSQEWKQTDRQMEANANVSANVVGNSLWP